MGGFLSVLWKYLVFRVPQDTPFGNTLLLKGTTKLFNPAFVIFRACIMEEPQIERISMDSATRKARLFNTLYREILAARLKVTLDKELNRHTSDVVLRLAGMKLPPRSSRQV
jgi:hypothetical protein